MGRGGLTRKTEETITEGDKMGIFPYKESQVWERVRGTC